ncbi:MAG TPA: hypothetical protein DEB31_11280 [Clostridiales bacterium]|nr:hypothetical protein [Clostridiales bacterium]
MMKYDNKEWTRRIGIANEVSLVEYCAHIGVPLVPFGSEYRHKEYDSLKVRGNKWKRWSGRSGPLGKFVQGYPIHFVMEYEGTDFEGALKRLLAFAAPDELPLPEGTPKKPAAKYDLDKRLRKVTGVSSAGQAQKVAAGEKERKPFIKPNANGNNERVYAYLTKTRGIDGGVVLEQLKLECLYESAAHHNCVFLGFDGNGNPAYAYMRGTYTNADKAFKGEAEGSIKEWSWRFSPTPQSSVVYVYESPIDALSHITINKERGAEWRNAHYLSLGCVSDNALQKFLQTHPGVTDIMFCLDNDKGGVNATAKLIKKYAPGYSCGAMQPPFGDWNEYLLGRKGEEHETPLEAAGT